MIGGWKVVARELWGEMKRLVAMVPYGWKSFGAAFCVEVRARKASGG